MYSLDDVNDMFKYHQPSEGQIDSMRGIRDAAKILASIILQMTPVCPDQTVAIRKLIEAVMVANRAICHWRFEARDEER